MIPDSVYFGVEEASVLLFDGCRAEDQEALKEGLATLERWTIVGKEFNWLTRELYAMHDAHSNFARQSLKEHPDVCKPS